MNSQASGGSTTTSSGLEQFPKFGPGELPVEYTPLNEQTLKARDRFGPVSYLVSAASHEHHAEFINRCSDANSSVDSCQLYPFEFWPLPRVMSQWRFGRLNEVISVRARRTVVFRPKVNHKLIGETVVRSVAKQGGLCFGFFESTTQ
ncbi:MAG: hypothetical protein MN733_17140, partial [Nitrososphaera sp.]|nr:hypothetical protein [Nitrososphaera sp.]